MCLQKRHSLRASASEDVREIWKNTSTRHVATDQIIVAHDSAAAASKFLKSEQSGLQVQGALIKCVTDSIASKNIQVWAAALDSLPSYLFNFARKALLQVQPHAASLKRWNRVIYQLIRLIYPSCPLYACGQSQTNKHVLSNCSNAAALRHYTFRHNDILSLLVSWLTSVKSASQLLYADLSDTRVLPICDIFTNCRPDLAIVDNNSIHILELSSLLCVMKLI